MNGYRTISRFTLTPRDKVIVKHVFEQINAEIAQYNAFISEYNKKGLENPYPEIHSACTTDLVSGAFVWNFAVTHYGNIESYPKLVKFNELARKQIEDSNRLVNNLKRQLEEQKQQNREKDKLRELLKDPEPPKELSKEEFDKLVNECYIAYKKQFGL